MTLQKGDRVTTPKGAGVVLYTRNAPPDFSTLEAVAVVLDVRKNDFGYTSTIFPAAQVTPVLTTALNIQKKERP
jgi:hypothetical protein